MGTILNICLSGPYSEGFTYQDNLLPKYHRRLGYDVVVFAPAYGWDKAGFLEHVGEEDYVNADGVHVVRVECDGLKPITDRFRRFGRLYQMMETVSPDIVFLHGVQMLDSVTVARYAERHPGVRLFVDNHADYSNSASSWVSKNILHRMLWGRCARRIDPCVQKWWGVLPARVDFLIENYGIPRDRCGLLMMGGDDDEVERALDSSAAFKNREGLGFSPEDFLIVTGGKIDSAKRQVLALMDAVAAIGGRARLLVFGPVSPELKGEFDAKLRDGVVHIPWANSSKSYDYLSMADLVVFPGRHSVYWEQSAALGKPMLVKRWDGTAHIDCGGNVRFTSGDDSESLAKDLRDIMEDELAFELMRDAAQKASGRFQYSDIARRSIE